MASEEESEAKKEATPEAAPTLDPNVIARVRQVTGLVNLEGKVSWAQLQMLEKLSDPLAQELVKIIHATEPAKRIWDRLLKKLKV